MILIPEQLYNIREEQRKNNIILKQDAEYLKESYNERKIGENSRMPRQEQLINDSCAYDREKSNEYYKILTQSAYLSSRNLESVDVGTKCYISLNVDGEEEFESLFMVDELIGVSNTEGYISKDSPIAKAIIGKKEGENFSYTIGKTTITGKICKIEKDPEEYMHFIREKKSCYRMTNKERIELKRLIAQKDINPQANIEYQNRKAITESQIKLLLDEKEFLEKNPKPTREMKFRLQNIYKALNENYALPPTDGTIGIGSTFSVMLFGKDKITSRRFEMINRAVGTELDTEYIERISALGSHIFGLKENEEFVIRGKDRYNIVGKVFDIDNDLNRYETNSALNYQFYKNRAKR